MYIKFDTNRTKDHGGDGDLAHQGDGVHLGDFDTLGYLVGPHRACIPNLVPIGPKTTERMETLHTGVTEYTLVTLTL